MKKFFTFCKKLILTPFVCLVTLDGVAERCAVVAVGGVTELPLLSRVYVPDLLLSNTCVLPLTVDSMCVVVVPEPSTLFSTVTCELALPSETLAYTEVIGRSVTKVDRRNSFFMSLVYTTIVKLLLDLQ